MVISLVNTMHIYFENKDYNKDAYCIENSGFFSKVDVARFCL